MSIAYDMYVMRNILICFVKEELKLLQMVTSNYNVVIFIDDKPREVV